jgi:hypothetical protein
MIRRKGDVDAGALVLLVDRGPSGMLVLSQTRDNEGRLAWLRPLGDQADEVKVEEFIAKTIKRDPDVWIIDIEDYRSEYRPDGPVL